MTTTKEEKENLRKWKEGREKAFPYAVSTCPNCGRPIHFPAGKDEIKCPGKDCPITVFREAKK